MPLLQWDPRFAVHVDELDEDHRRLFLVINDLWQAVEAKAERDVLAGALGQLTALMGEHLRREEELLAHWRYPRLRQHAQEHQHLMGRLSELTADVERGNGAAIDAAALDFIGEWLCTHILKSDNDYAQFRSGQMAGGALAPAATAKSASRPAMAAGSVTLHVALISLVLSMNLFVAGLLAYALNAARHQQEKEVRATVENMALLLDHTITGSVDKIDLSLREIADRLGGKARSDRAMDRGEVDALLMREGEWLSGLASFRVTDAAGIIRFGPGVVAEEAASLADRDYFIAHRRRPDLGLVVSNPVFGRVAKEWLISFSRRYEDGDGNFAGIISAAVPVSHFTRILSGLDLGPNGIALLRDAQTALITRAPPNPTQMVGSKGFSKELADIIASGEVARTFHARQTGDGIERVDSYRRLASVPFHLVVGLGTEDYLSQWRDNVRKAVAIAVLFLIVSTTAGWLVWRSLSLTEKAERSAQLAGEIARTKQKLSEAHRIARLGFAEMNPATGLWSLGEGTQEMLGIDRGISVGISSEILTRVNPQDRAQLLDLLAISGGACFDMEIRVDDRVLHALGEPLGPPLSLTVITFQDTTQRHLAERERAAMMERMAESGRLESLGTLAGGVAHEINTPAQYIGDNLAFLKDWLPRLLDVVDAARQAAGSGDWSGVAERAMAIKFDFAARELPAAVDQAAVGIGRISAIVQAIKEFSYPSGKSPQPFDLNRAVELAATVTRSQWKHVAELSLDLAPALPMLTAIEGEINQVLVNLIVNAAQAIGEAGSAESGRIEIATRLTESQVEVSVKDSGIGIPKENLDRLFELFFTTKPPGQGTGQGLAISNAVVHRHGGTITVESEPGAGACFRVRLPIELAARSCEESPS